MMTNRNFTKNQRCGETWQLLIRPLRMAGLALAALLTLSTASAVETAVAPADFAGIKWRTSKAAAGKLLAAGPGVISQGPNDDGNLVFSGGKFANKRVIDWTLEFDEGKFCGGTVVLEPEGRVLFDAVCQYFSGQYGATESSTFEDGALESSWVIPVDSTAREFVTLQCIFQPTAEEPKYNQTVRIHFAIETPSSNASADPDSSLSGTWNWGNQSVMVINRNGTVKTDQTTGTWKWEKQSEGILKVQWENAKTEHLVLSASQQYLSRKSADGRLEVGSRAVQSTGSFFGSSSNVVVEQTVPRGTSTPIPTPTVF